jgi:hypothetical protein
MDAWEKESCRSTLRESRPSMKFSNFVALICSVIDFKTSSVHAIANQQGWKDVSMQDDVCDIVPRSKAKPFPGGSSGNTFLAKRGC